MCAPLTEKLPAPAVIVPGEVVPSPQLIVAVKSATVFAGFPLVNVATGFVNDTPFTAVKLIGVPTSTGTTVMLSVTVTVAGGFASIIVMVAVNGPTAA